MMKREICYLACLFAVLLVVTMLMAQVYSPRYGDEQSEMVIAMMHDDVEIKQCLAALANETGIRTKINVITDEDDLTDYDARRKLNLELLSGDGPDILIMDDIDSLPMRKAGAIIDPVPVARSWYILSWKANAVPGGPSLKALVDSAEENSLHFDNGFDIVGPLTFRSYISSALSGDMEKDKEILTSFFRDLKRLRNLFTERHAWVSFYQGNEICTGFASFDQIVSGKADLAMDYLTGMDDLQELTYLSKVGELQFSAGLFPEKGCPRCILAINKNARNRKTAMDYVNYASSKEGQIIIAKSGLLPADPDVLYAYLQHQGPRSVVTPDHTIEIGSISEDDIEVIRHNLPSSMGKPNDGIIMQMIMQEAACYLNEEKTIGEAAESAVEHIWLKQNE